MVACRPEPAASSKILSNGVERGAVAMERGELVVHRHGVVLIDDDPMILQVLRTLTDRRSALAVTGTAAMTDAPADRSGQQ
jgi:hypothetical protein